jgi:hypothetical protein
MPKKDDNQANVVHFESIIKKGCELLMTIMCYGQINIVNKLTVRRYKISTAWLSSFLNGTRPGKPDVLMKISEGIQYLVEQELGYTYQYELQAYSTESPLGWEQKVQPESEQEIDTLQSVKFHDDGRVPVQYKTAFFANAQHEVIEIGVRLNTFSSYFTSQNDQVYKAHIIKLLERGVNIKGYLLDPESNEARIYFHDRAKVQIKENDAIDEMKRVKENLRSLVREFAQMGLKGKFEIYEYKHIPYGNFFVVDGAEPDGKMMMANYIYGIRRAESPVWEFSKKANPPLYRKHWESVQKFIADAKKLE